MRNKDPDKQHRIKAAMIRLILREGINGTSVSKIAKEAGVSPATIYVYYESKEDMLSEVFREYFHRTYGYLSRRVSTGMSGAELIENLVKGYYVFSIEHPEVFSFIEQCSRCPTIQAYVSEEECCCEIFDLIHSSQMRGEMRRYGDMNISAVLFGPVRALAMNRRLPAERAGSELDELVTMLKSMLLK